MRYIRTQGSRATKPERLPPSTTETAEWGHCLLRMQLKKMMKMMMKVHRLLFSHDSHCLFGGGEDEDEDYRVRWLLVQGSRSTSPHLRPRFRPRSDAAADDPLFLENQGSSRLLLVVVGEISDRNHQT